MNADERRQHTQNCQRAHAEGYLAREDGEGREVCPYLTAPYFEFRHWWLGGWHDKDQELDTRRATA